MDTARSQRQQSQGSQPPFTVLFSCSSPFTVTQTRHLTLTKDQLNSWALPLSWEVTYGYWSHTCPCPSWYLPCFLPLVPSSLGLNQNPFSQGCITLLLLLPSALSLGFLSLLHFQKQQDTLITSVVVFLKKWSSRPPIIQNQEGD